jgi:hypothetical protein
VRMLRRPTKRESLLIFLAGVLVILVASSSGSLASLSSPSVPAIARDLTLSFDARPAFSEFDSIQPGFKCVDRSIAGTRKSPSAAFVRDKSRRNVRHGKYSARVVLKPGDHASYTCKAEAGVLSIILGS